MPTSLDALTSLTSNAQNPNGLVAARRRKEQALLEMQRSLEHQAGDPLHTFSGATYADVNFDQAQLDADPDFGTEAVSRTKDVENLNADMAAYNRPDVTAQRRNKFADELAMKTVPEEIKAKGALAVTNAETEGSIRKMGAQNDATAKLLELVGGTNGGSGGGGMAGPGGHIKPTINANGGVSFTTTPMPALVQRARNQLMDARDKTLAALDAAERQYAGINDEATKTDQQHDAPGWMSFLTGAGSQKYGSAADMAGARNDRAKYDVGLPTPFSELAQTASFGNIEQMAGQLPGVRGLATITPLFKEHQSRWGHETPLATVQRLRHMAKLMDETLTTLDTSGAGPEQP